MSRTPEIPLIPRALRGNLVARPAIVSPAAFLRLTLLTSDLPAMTFSENVARLQPSATMAVSSLAKRLRAEGRDIIDLSAGEPDFDTPSWLVDAAVEGVRGGATRYTPAAGMPELRAAIAKSLAARGADAIWSDVVVTAGAKQALFNACFTFFGPGDEVMIASPYWTSYPEMVTLSRAEPVFVQGPAEKGFVLRPRDLDAARTARTRGLIMCSPSNPTGAVYTRAELSAVARWARDNGVRLINDEIYRHIHFDGDDPAPGLLELDPADVGPFVLIDGVSKAFAMTGWRIGFSYCEGAGAKKMAAFQSHTTSNPASPSQLAALAAYSDVERSLADIAEMVVAYKRRLRLVVSLMRELLPELSFVDPGGAFYLFFRVDSVCGEGEGSNEFCTRILEEAGVAMVPGSAFGDDRYARMSFATSDDLLSEAIRRMARVLRGG